MNNLGSHNISSTTISFENPTTDVLVKNFREFNYNITAIIEHGSGIMIEYLMNSDMSLLDLLENLCKTINSLFKLINKNLN